MDRRVIADTGPLVALLNRRDRAHAWSVRQLETMTEPLVTCDAVLSEAFFLLKRSTDSGVKQLSEMIRRGLVYSQFNFTENQPFFNIISTRYIDCMCV